MRVSALVMVMGMTLGCMPEPSEPRIDAGSDAGDQHEGCPQDLPLIADWGEGVSPRAVRVGSTVTFTFFDLNQECIEIDTLGPAGPFAVDVMGSSVSFVATLPGTWSVTIRHWTRTGRSYSLSVEAQSPPPTVQPCAMLPRSCSRVYDGQSHLTCDDTLYTRGGVALRTLDGGAWFGSGDSLFGWEDGVLRRLSVSDAGLEELASWALPRPRLWGLGAERLAVGTEDGGVLFDLASQGLVPLGEFSVLPEHQALVVLPNGRVMIAADSTDFACLVDGGCARDRYVANARPALVAANEQGVYVLIQHGFFGRDPLLFSPTEDGGFTDLYWGSIVGTKQTVTPGAQVPRRPHVATVWGMAVEGVQGVMTLTNAQRWSSTDGVVWASSDLETAIWCEPR